MLSLAYEHVVRILSQHWWRHK